MTGTGILLQQYDIFTPFRILRGKAPVCCCIFIVIEKMGFDKIFLPVIMEVLQFTRPLERLLMSKKSPKAISRSREAAESAEWTVT